MSKKYLYAFFLIIFAMHFYGCMDESSYQKALKEDSKIIADQVANNISVIFFDSTWTKAILKADRAEIYTNEFRTEISGNVKLEYFSKKTGSRMSVLTCNKAIVDDKTKNMTAEGNVVVFSDSAGVKLETTRLHWDNQKELIYTKEYIVITTPRETIRGFGFESKLDLSNYKIYKVSGIQQ